MNFQRKQSAVNKFKPMVENNIPKDQLKTNILADEKAYTEDEANEIIEALLNPSPDVNAGNNEPAATKVEEKVNFNKKYEEFSVELKKGSKLNDDGFYDDTCFEKTKIKPNRTTHITEDRAFELNLQSHNSRVRYYEVKG
jgi:hypothetical protein